MKNPICSTKNRFGFRVRVGDEVGMHLPRGSFVNGKVAKIEHEGVYGFRVTLDSGFSGSTDDCFSSAANPQ